MDKLDASESLRKEEEQATETQPIVYGNALVHVLSIMYFTFKTSLPISCFFPEELLGNGNILHVKSSLKECVPKY